MKLLSLECSFFRQHVQSNLTFAQGLIGIVGPNGSGKSTIVEAIVFALFGSRAVRGKVAGLSTRGRKRKKARVALRFEHAGHVFFVERSSTDAALYVGGATEAIATGTKAVNDRIQSLLGIGLDEFLSTYCTEQKGLEFLSGKKGATERARFIIQMMGYDKLERAQELLRRDRRDLKNHLLGLESGLGNNDDLVATCEKERLSIKELKSDLQALENVITAAEKDTARIAEEWHTLEKERLVYDRLHSEQKGLELKIESADTHISKLEKILATRQGKLDTLFDSLEKWNVSAQEVEAELKVVSKDLTALRGSRRQEQEQWEESRVAMRAAVASHESECARLQGHKDHLESLKSQAHCPTCGQELGKAYERLLIVAAEETEHAIVALTKQREQLGAIEQRPVALSEIDDQLVRLEAAEERCREAMKTLVTVQELQHEMQDDQRELDTVQQARNTAKVDLQAVRGKIEKLGFSEKRHAASRVAFETAKKLLDANKMKRLKLEGALETQQALLKRSEEALLRFKTQSAEIAEKKRTLLLLDESDKAFTDVRNQVNASIRPRLADLASEFLTDLTDGRYSSVEIAEDFAPTVFEDGEPKPVISGGEEDILNLCVRLALSQLVAERAGHAMSFLILDEVFGSLDETRRYNVLTLLEKLRNRFDQVLLITHLDDIKEGVEHFIQVDYDDASGEVNIDSLEGYELLAMNV